MKKFFLISLVAFMASFISVDAQKYLGYVSDPDGFTYIRAAASNKAEILGDYTSGEYLYYTPLKNGWSKVYSDASSSSFMGYMHTSRIVRVEAQNEDVAGAYESAYEKGYIVDPDDDYVNVRKGPGTNYAIVCRLAVSTDVLFEKTKSKWVKVYDEDGNYLGYVYRSRISQHL
jgi:uncharacterized protein YgiM (DUF1202 family)